MKEITIPNRFNIDGYEIKLKHSIKCNFIFNSKDDTYYYDNDKLFIYVSGTIPHVLVERIKKEILYSILYYMNCKDTTLTNTGFELKHNLIDCIVYCIKEGDLRTSILLIEDIVKDKCTKRLKSCLEKEFNIINIGPINKINDCSEDEITQLLNKITSYINKNNIKSIIYSIPSLSRNDDYHKEIFIINKLRKYNFCVVTEETDCNLIDNYGGVTILNIDNIIEYENSEEYCNLKNIICKLN